MGTITAQILIGNEHPYHGGIAPIHYMFLSENDRPAWILVSQNIYPRGEDDRFPKVVWIPTPGRMLEDALLMIAIHLLKNEELTARITEKFPDLLSRRVEDYKSVSDADWKELHEMVHNIPNWPKLGVSVFEGSSILHELDVLKNYPGKIEVCLSADIKQG